ncbi:MAG: hypothetical protein JO007_14480 [Alphaproteobacteria bacterium]|nr:hypothetical protein [Alphaproteobacteria bacterium]
MLFAVLLALGVTKKHDAAQDTRGHHPKNGLGLHYSRFRQFQPIGSLPLNYLPDEKSKILPPIGQVRLDTAEWVTQKIRMLAQWQPPVVELKD